MPMQAAPVIAVKRNHLRAGRHNGRYLGVDRRDPGPAVGPSGISGWGGVFPGTRENTRVFL